MIREGVMISGRYEVMGRIGTGGMADVYKCVDRTLNRYVAVKVLKREFREDEIFVKKFHTEAQSAAGLSHPNIVSVYDVGEDRGLYYIVMELVEGITLKDYIQKKGRLTPKEVISIGVQVCMGMNMAHSHNIIHRDIKPQNIMISREGKIKVTDFGIAKATSTNTISTNVMGSVHYTSPEQARGGYSDAKSDIYSLGITMYEMITGMLPFDGDSTVSIALKHLQEDIIAPSEVVKKVPYSLEQIILKCTQKSPARRYSDITQLEKDLRRALVEPDGDFVVIAPFNAADTRMVTQEELERIQQAAEDGGYDEDYYDDDDYEERRTRKQGAGQKGIDPKIVNMMKILAIVVVLLLLIFAFFGLGKFVGNLTAGGGTGQTTESGGKKVKVPSLVGLTKEEAEQACEEAGLKLKIKSRENSDKFDEGMIIRQLTEEGTKLSKGAYVQVVVSTGRLIEMPDMAEKGEFKDVRDELVDEYGFKRDNIIKKEEPHPTIEKGYVTRTNPPAGELVAKNAKITVYVSSGVEMVKMPDLVGKTDEEAKKLLESEDVGLVPKPTEEYSDKPKGTVISQEIDADEEIEKGSEVSYVVSKGEKPKEMVLIPALPGVSIAEARADLKNLGFEVKEKYQTDPEVPNGYVISVQGAGTEAEKGSTVVVVVSTGSSGSSTDGGGTGSESTP